MLIKQRLSVAAASAIFAVSLTAAQTDAADFAGKTVSLIIGQSMGGGSGLLAQTFAPYLGKHLPGKPQVIVKSITGAGGTKATNYVYEKAKPDGTTLTWSGFNPIGVLTKAPGLRAKFDKMEFIGSGGVSRVMLVSTTPHGGPKLTKLADYMKLDQPIRLTGYRPTGNLDLVGRLGLEVMGIKYRYIAGYRGAAKVLPAMIQGESDALSTSITTYRARVEDTWDKKEGKIIPLWYVPYFDVNGNPVKNPTIPDFPALHEAYEKIHGKQPSGKYWEALKFMQTVSAQISLSTFAPPKTPKDIVETLRAAYNAAKVDPAYIAESNKRFGGTMQFMSVDEGLHAIKVLKDASPDMTKFLKDFIAAASK